MKKLTNVKTQIDGTKVTITGDLSDSERWEYLFPTQRVTVGHLNPKNLKWPRHVQISNEALFVKSTQGSIAIPHDELVNMAAWIEPKTSFPPIFEVQPSKEATAKVVSELPVSFQWQTSLSVKKDEVNWQNISGETDVGLKSNPSSVFVRLIISNSAGQTVSNMYKL